MGSLWVHCSGAVRCCCLALQPSTPQTKPTLTHLGPARAPLPPAAALGRLRLARRGALHACQVPGLHHRQYVHLPLAHGCARCARFGLLRVCCAGIAVQCLARWSSQLRCALCSSVVMRARSFHPCRADGGRGPGLQPALRLRQLVPRLQAPHHPGGWAGAWLGGRMGGGWARMGGHSGRWAFCSGWVVLGLRCAGQTLYRLAACKRARVAPCAPATMP